MLTRAKRRHKLRPTTPRADMWYDAGAFLRKLERRKVTPHVPITKPPRDPKTVPQKNQVPDIRARRRMQARLADEGYTLSQRCRKKIEEGSGGWKTVAGLACGRRGRELESTFTLTCDFLSFTERCDDCLRCKLHSDALPRGSGPRRTATRCRPSCMGRRAEEER